MRNFQEKRWLKRILESPLVLIFLVVLIFIFAWNVFGFWGRMRETAKNRKIAEAKIEELQKEQEKLTTDIAKLKTEEGVEESIRDKFGLAKEGEGMIIVVEDKSEPKQNDSKNKDGIFIRLRNIRKRDRN